MLLGCIGDDFTGSSDLANTLAKQGMRTVQYTGVPLSDATSDIEAGIVALKSRSNDPKIAIEQSLKALDWLKRQGCQQFFFKYCSTFDSTPMGNIGPVIEALAEALEAHKIIVCPAFPGTGRSIYQGHLFVNDVLLNESGMQDHPITPMVDSDIRRWLKRQTKFNVGHVAAPHVLKGVDAIKMAMEDEHQKGNRVIIVDALQDADLLEIGRAAVDLPLITGGSGVALGLPANFIKKGLVTGLVKKWKPQIGKCVVLSGSCSKATRAQIAFHSKTNPTFEIMAADVIEGRLQVETVANWLVEKKGIPIAYSSADPKIVRSIQEKFGSKKSAEAIENFFAEVSQKLVEKGVECILTAGGETSGAVVEGLQLKELEIGPEIDPGVPALRAGPNLVLALKSGNFGAEDYFSKAAKILTSSN